MAKTAAERQAEVSKLQLSPVPAIAAIQKEAQAYYVQNGTWSTALHDKAEAVRTGLNPMYTGSKDGSTESKYILGGSEQNLDGLSSLFSGFSDLFGFATQNAGQAATEVTKPESNMTWLIVGGILLLLFARR